MSTDRSDEWMDRYERGESLGSLLDEAARDLAQAQGRIRELESGIKQACDWLMANQDDLAIRQLRALLPPATENQEAGG